ncbi:MAG: hypothetical protein GXP27_10235 [Planctomycetes bacterium]|nr:hypothetical protein [Planctomycetota bacterium]
MKQSGQRFRRIVPGITSFTVVLGSYVVALAQQAVIVRPADAPRLQRLAAREIARYVYLHTGELLPIAEAAPGGADVIAVRVDANTLKPQHYRLKTATEGDCKTLEVAGGDPLGTLYGAYRLAEHLGARFYLHGDVVPDERIEWRLPELDETAGPLFNLRGIQPFHDFPEGPDWWNADDYKAILSQLAKLRMNFLGLHCYPEGGVGPEPLVWIGLPQDVNPDGTVRFSYPARHFTTANVTGAWGYRPMKTSDYAFGAALLFDRDDFGPDYMRGMNPFNEQTLEQSNELFNRVGRMLNDAFSYARLLQIRTCLGIETPLTIPAAVKQHLKEQGKNPNDPAVVRELYEGIFRRILAAHPLDYFWFWTPEGWTWSGTKPEQVERTVQDLKLALAAADRVDAPFPIGTCGWVLGPDFDRALFDRFLPKRSPMSCINRNVGFSPVEIGFARIKGRPKWAIPWMEDDPALIIPQLWAGRMRRDAADAHAYGCTGLMGIHWRTRILGHNVAALAHAAWDQRVWNPEFGKPPQLPKLEEREGRLGGNPAAFPGHQIADTENDTVYRTVRWAVRGYRFKLPNGAYRVTLQFCEPHYREKGKRVFGATLQGRRVIERLDIFAQVGPDRALDFTFEKVKVTDGWLRIDFVPVVEHPSIAGIVIEQQTDANGNRPARPLVRKINCAGPAWKDYEADLEDVSPEALLAGRPRDLPVDDFYADWARSQFGPEVAEPLAKLFAQLDGQPSELKPRDRKTNLPRPSTWVHGPGGIRPDPRPWEQVAAEYGFVDQMAALRAKVRGAGNRERFDYWLNQFRYLRAIGRLNCLWGQFEAAVKKLEQEKDSAKRLQLAEQTAFPIRRQIIQQLGEVHRYLLASVTTWGGLGNVTNWQQHVIPMLLDAPAQRLEKLLGQPLPDELKRLPTKYAGPARIIVPTVRTLAEPGERLTVRVIVLSDQPPTEVTLHARPLGRGRYRPIAARHIARGVYRAQLPAAERLGVEYYVTASRWHQADMARHCPPCQPDSRRATMTGWQRSP